MGFIYIIENLVNHRKYVGQSIKNKLNRRVSKTLNSHTRDNQDMLNDVNKYGIDNFHSSIILHCENYMLDYWEKWFILLYNCRKVGYNKDLGGWRGKHNEGRICPICGDTFRNYEPSCDNKFCSDECRNEFYKRTRKRIINKCLQCGKDYEIHECEKKTSKFCSVACKNKYNSKRMKGNTYSVGKLNGANNGRAKKCMCLETGKVYECARYASNELGLTSNGVAQVCNGIQKTAKGFHFVWC